MEGVILLNHRLDGVRLSTATEAKRNGSCSSTTGEETSMWVTNHTNHSNILYDSVVAVTLANGLNFTNASYPGATGPVKINRFHK